MLKTEVRIIGNKKYILQNHVDRVKPIRNPEGSLIGLDTSNAIWYSTLTVEGTDQYVIKNCEPRQHATFEEMMELLAKAKEDARSTEEIEER